MKAYADTSFIVCLYVPDRHRTLAAVSYMERHREALPFTPHHRLEVRNAVRLLVWSNRISAAERATALRQIEQDLDDEDYLHHIDLDYTSTYRKADRLGAAHNEKVGCRSADLFHVAASVELGFGDFLTFDTRQKKLASAAGLNVTF